MCRVKSGYSCLTIWMASKPSFFFLCSHLYCIMVQAACWGSPSLFTKLYALGWSKSMVWSASKPCFLFGGCNEKASAWFIWRTTRLTPWLGETYLFYFYLYFILLDFAYFLHSFIASWSHACFLIGLLMWNNYSQIKIPIPQAPLSCLTRLLYILKY